MLAPKCGYPEFSEKKCDPILIYFVFLYDSDFGL